MVKKGYRKYVELYSGCSIFFLQQVPMIAGSRVVTYGWREDTTLNMVLNKIALHRLYPGCAIFLIQQVLMIVGSRGLYPGYIIFFIQQVLMIAGSRGLLVMSYSSFNKC
ncbi:uncharacterized protein LOC110817296 isoform X2 [Carica papaya]|uniref:uncharacterized protein LOC110817296 isoform X2 n=1 Tax=Carica papaya TaxID=3649 RepID=UPI000B8C8F87|nr:uncharacterized protein LOC110817296 isoform X2 [Carica papaya]XP_021901453.1 uncharacterized protein LOC110817296 isoform X2 [Carica papaya]XP_021901454.1 uncharacterized protein LOC110817296 isoform X2 [Carica papaya]XP_021901455.1 uncharacterized protein LOC110817296 isoform X2 [Carica papaya]XP_021901456.1 uncharacterized protein LOC110817296 isoform X2 [Carica papaya]XP_021901457.1 uncharacterized protein LOC110817296 isoform X2 [Carica papaya]